MKPIKSPPKFRWISVKERLPDNDKDVAVLLYKYQRSAIMTVGIACYIKPHATAVGDWFLNDNSDDVLHVTHWYPLPPLPKKN